MYQRSKGTPNREPQEYSRNILENKDPDRYIPIVFLLYSERSLNHKPYRLPLESFHLGEAREELAALEDAGQVSPSKVPGSDGKKRSRV